jgi:hypothetical protein
MIKEVESFGGIIRIVSGFGLGNNAYTALLVANVLFYFITKDKLKIDFRFSSSVLTKSWHVIMLNFVG